LENVPIQYLSSGILLVNILQLIASIAIAVIVYKKTHPAAPNINTMPIMPPPPDLTCDSCTNFFGNREEEPCVYCKDFDKWES